MRIISSDINKPTQAGSKLQAGSTLIEAIVALLVFSVGVLGIAALQATTLMRSDDVKQRSIAIWKAQELADRIRATKRPTQPEGEILRYINLIGSDVGVIGSVDNSNPLVCAAAAPAQCEDTAAGPAAVCSIEQMVQFDVWSVLCDPINGVSDTQQNVNLDGANKLKNFDFAMTQAASGEVFLYFEWLARANAENREAGANAAPVTLTTDLCGTDVDVDERLEAYCLRFF